MNHALDRLRCALEGKPDPGRTPLSEIEKLLDKAKAGMFTEDDSKEALLEALRKKHAQLAKEGRV